MSLIPWELILLSFITVLVFQIELYVNIMKKQPLDKNFITLLAENVEICRQKHQRAIWLVKALPNTQKYIIL